MHKVVVPFPCSWDGITLVDLQVGDERDFGSMAAGLVGMGWIEPVGEVAADNPVVDIGLVAEREVAIELLPIEFAVETQPLSTGQPFEKPRRGRQRK